MIPSSTQADVTDAQDWGAEIVGMAPRLWPALKGARIFMTGCTGFFGRWLLEGLLRANREMDLGVKVNLLSRNPQIFASQCRLADDPAVTLWEGDVRSFEFPRHSLDLIIHGATDASARINREQPELVFDTIVSGTRRVLDLARRRGTARILLLSSGAVYGPQPASIPFLREDFLGGPNQTAPASAYAEGKRVAELMCCLQANSGSLKAAIARCFAFSGPYLPLDREFAIGNFVQDAASGRSIRVNGDGRAERSYLDGADLSVWLWTILLKGKSCRPYNVGSEHRVSVGDLAKEVAREGGGCPVSIRGRTVTPHASRYSPSTSRARRELGLRQSISRRDSIRRMLRWADLGRAE